MTLLDIDRPLSQFKAHVWYHSGNANLPKDSNMSDTKDLPEWISTGEASRILNLKSTQAIRDFIADGTLTQVLDVGTEKKPHYLVNRAEVEALAKKRSAQ